MLYYFSRNFLALNVHYPEISQEEITQGPAYTFWDLLCKCVAQKANSYFNCVSWEYFKPIAAFQYTQPISSAENYLRAET